MTWFCLSIIVMLVLFLETERRRTKIELEEAYCKGFDAGKQAAADQVEMFLLAKKNGMKKD